MLIIYFSDNLKYLIVNNITLLIFFREYVYEILLYFPKFLNISMVLHVFLSKLRAEAHV